MGPDACRIAAEFPVESDPLRYYIEGIQTKKFNEQLTALGDRVNAVTVRTFGTSRG